MSSSDALEDEDLKKRFDPYEFFFNNRIPVTLFLVGVIIIGLGVLVYKYGFFDDSSKIEVLEAETKEVSQGEIMVEISGEVSKPGVYKLSQGARVEDLLIASGGLAEDADRVWVEKYINRAARLTDGQKIYIPSQDELAPQQDYQSSVRGANNEGGAKPYQQSVSGVGAQSVNINTASQKELEELPGIGPVYAQSIIEHRPYSTVEELLSKGALKEYVYEKVKDQVVVY